MGFPQEVSYGAAKAALENYTMAASSELAPYGITANIVHPPVTDTGWVTDEVRALVARLDRAPPRRDAGRGRRGHRLAVLRRRPPRHGMPAPPAVSGRAPSAVAFRQAGG